MSDKDIGRMIMDAVDSIPIPWERLWAVFQKILQRTLKEKEKLPDKSEKLWNRDKGSGNVLSELWNQTGKGRMGSTS